VIVTLYYFLEVKKSVFMLVQCNTLLCVNPPCEGALYWKRERETKNYVAQ